MFSKLNFYEKRVSNLKKEKETPHTSSDLPIDGESNVGEGKEEQRKGRKEIKKLKGEIKEIKEKIPTKGEVIFNALYVSMFVLNTIIHNYTYCIYNYILLRSSRSALFYFSTHSTSHKHEHRRYTNTTR